MSNSLYNDFNPTPMSQMGNFINKFNQYRQTFMGDPEARVKQLLQSGQMSQAQFEQLAQTATQLRQLIK
jgi:hypothetical protein